jgi:hypothetical protein
MQVMQLLIALTTISPKRRQIRWPAKIFCMYISPSSALYLIAVFSLRHFNGGTT